MVDIERLQHRLQMERAGSFGTVVITCEECSDLLAELRTLRALRDKVEAAPVANGSVYADGSLAHVEKWWPRDDAPFVGSVLVKLVQIEAAP